MFPQKLLLLVSLGTLVSAQTIKECVVDVLETNPKVQERLKNYNSISQDIDIAQSDYWPKLDLNLGAGYENTDRYSRPAPTADDRNQGYEVYQNSLRYTQNLFKGFETYHKVQEEEARAGAAAYSFIETANDTAFEMVNTYLQTMRNVELLSTAQENVDINEKILTKVQKLYNSGLTTRSEVNKIESSLYLAKTNYIVQENNLLDAQYNLQRVLGRPTYSEEMQRPDLNNTKVPSSVDAAAQFAMKNNPSLLVSNYNIELAQATWKEKQSNYYPHIDIEISQSMNKNLSAIEGNEDRFRAMAFLSYNFFNGFEDQAQIQKNVSKIHQEIATKNDLRRQVVQGLQLSYASYIKLQEQMVQLQKYKEFSLKTLTLYAKEYDLGRRSLLDLLSAQNDFIGAKAQIINTEYSLLFSKYRILDAMGIMVASILDDTDLLYSQVNLGTQKEHEEDNLPVYLDNDNDGIVAEKDVCDNTLEKALYNLYGCQEDKNSTGSIKRFPSLVFDDEADLDGDSEEILAQITKELKALTPQSFEVTLLGNVEHKDFNSDEAIRISQKRANLIETALIDAGISQESITTVAQGSDAPLYSNESSEGQELNNRVDVIVTIKTAK